MRLIDADDLPKYTGYALSADEVAMAVENAPTIETISGYRIEHLIWLARVMSKEGVTPEDLVEVLKDIGRVINMVISEQQEIFRRTVEEMIKNETD